MTWSEEQKAELLTLLGKVFEWERSLPPPCRDLDQAVQSRLWEVNPRAYPEWPFRLGECDTLERNTPSWWGWRIPEPPFKGKLLT